MGIKLVAWFLTMRTQETSPLKHFQLEHGMCECVICCWKFLFKGYNFLVEIDMWELWACKVMGLAIWQIKKLKLRLLFKILNFWTFYIALSILTQYIVRKRMVSTLQIWIMVCLMNWFACDLFHQYFCSNLH